jgi:hypothetical protein
MDHLPLVGAFAYFGIIFLVVFALILTGKYVSGAPFFEEHPIVDNGDLVQNDRRNGGQTLRYKFYNN